MLLPFFVVHGLVVQGKNARKNHRRKLSRQRRRALALVAESEIARTATETAACDRPVRIFFGLRERRHLSIHVSKMCVTDAADFAEYLRMSLDAFGIIWFQI